MDYNKFNMQIVSEDVFYNFIKDKNYRIIQGEIFHSHYYIDERGEKVAYYESSSWTPNVEYRIKDEIGEYDNYESLNFICNIINGK